MDDFRRGVRINPTKTLMAAKAAIAVLLGYILGAVYKVAVIHGGVVALDPPEAVEPAEQDASALAAIGADWWTAGIAVENSDAFFLSWLADRVDAAAAAWPAPADTAETTAAGDTAAAAAGPRGACPPGGIAFIFEDAGDAFVLDAEGPSLVYVLPGRWPGAGAAPGLALFLHSRVAWHGLLSMGGAEKDDTFAAALDVGIFRAAAGGADGRGRAADAARLLPACVAAFDAAFDAAGGAINTRPASRRPGSLPEDGEDAPAGFLYPVAGRLPPARREAAVVERQRRLQRQRQREQDDALGECPAEPANCVLLSPANVSAAAEHRWPVPAIVRGLPPWPASLAWMEHFDFEAGPASPSDESVEAQRAFIKLFDAYYGRPGFVPPTGNLRISYSKRGGGVTFCHHAFSWLRILRGRKLWFFAPPDVPMPPNTHRNYCLDPRQAPPAGVTHICDQRENDLMIVPTLWWHATCNMEDDRMTFALGSQGPELSERVDRVHQADTAMARVRDPDALARLIEQHSSSVAARARRRKMIDRDVGTLPGGEL